PTAASLTVTVESNTITGSHSQACNFVTATGSTGGSMTATVRSNTIGTAGVLDSGSAIGSGIRVANGGVNVSFTIDSNVIREVPNASGIEFGPQAYSVNANVKCKIINNTIVRPTGTNQAVCGPAAPCPTSTIFALSDSNGLGGFDHECFVITGNSVWDPTSYPLGAGNAAFYFARRTSASNTLQVEGTQANIKAQILATNTITNPGPTPGASDVIDENTSGTVTIVPAGTCGAFPPIPPPGDIGTMQAAQHIESASAEAGAAQAADTLTVVNSQRPADVSVRHLTPAEVEWMRQAALARWEQAGISPDDLAKLRAVTIEVTDLPGRDLAHASSTRLTIDETAAGYGWFFDQTPNQEYEFDVPVDGKEIQTTEVSSAY